LKLFSQPVSYFESLFSNLFLIFVLLFFSAREVAIFGNTLSLENGALLTNETISFFSHMPFVVSEVVSHVSSDDGQETFDLNQLMSFDPQPNYVVIDHIVDETITPENRIEAKGPLKSINQRNEENFDLNWTKIPEDLMLEIKSGKICGRALTSFTNLAMDQMRLVVKNCSMGFIKNVAQSIATKYPAFIEKDIEGNVLSDRPVFLISKMANRNKYLNLEKEKSVKADVVPLKKRRTASNLAKSVLTYKPEIDSMAAATMQILKQELITGDLPDYKIEEHMRATFKLQRQRLDDLQLSQQLSDIKAEWPYLLVRPYMDIHFNMLTGFVLSRAGQNYPKYEKNGIIHLQTKGFMENSAASALTTSFKFISGLAAYFKEDPAFLVKSFPIGTTTIEICKSYIPAAYFIQKGKEVNTLGPVICEVGM
jgi:hypothetical protein